MVLLAERARRWGIVATRASGMHRRQAPDQLGPPDGSDDQSFPSSYSLKAFSAAASLSMFSGLSLSAPAFVAAGIVTYGRLAAQRHHLKDVVVGGAVGVASAWGVAGAIRHVTK